MEDVLIVFIVFSFATFICAGIYKLIKAKIEQTNIDEDTFDRLAKAFMEHKNETNRRIQNLEAIISNESSSATSTSYTEQIEASKQTIEIEDQEEQQKSSTKRDTHQGLTNDLNKKQRMQ